jgi:hypothetical protein
MTMMDSVYLNSVMITKKNTFVLVLPIALKMMSSLALGQKQYDVAASE